MNYKTIKLQNISTFLSSLGQFFYIENVLLSTNHILPALVRCNTTDINSLFIFLSYGFLWLCLLRQAISLIWIKVSGSSLSKLASSRLILSRSTLKISISSQKVVTLLKCSVIKIISILANKESSSFLIILLVTNQSGTYFVAARK